MSRIPKMPPRPSCPPHEWKDVSEEANVAYLLRCQKCGEEYPP